MSENNPILFSVIIPTYNRGPFIKKAIQSVLNQTYVNWEIIIIDDGSTDDTRQVINSYKDLRIKYIFQENQERSIARNNGINHTQGDFICFLDSDDYYLDTHLEQVNNHICSSLNKDFFFTNFQFDKGGEFDIPPIANYKNGSSIVNYLILHPIATGRAVIRRRLLESNMFNPKIRIGEDIELWSRIATDIISEQISIHTYIQVEHDDRSIRTNSSQIQKEHLRTLREINKNTKHFNKNSKINTAYSYAYLKIGDAYLNEKNKRKALFSYLNGMIIKPLFLTKRFVYQIIQCFK